MHVLELSKSEVKHFVSKSVSVQTVCFSHVVRFLYFWPSCFILVFILRQTYILLTWKIKRKKMSHSGCHDLNFNPSSTRSTLQNTFHKLQVVSLYCDPQIQVTICKSWCLKTYLFHNNIGKKRNKNYSHAYLAEGKAIEHGDLNKTG